MNFGGDEMAVRFYKYVINLIMVSEYLVVYYVIKDFKVVLDYKIG